MTEKCSTLPPHQKQPKQAIVYKPLNINGIKITEYKSEQDEEEIQLLEEEIQLLEEEIQLLEEEIGLTEVPHSKKHLNWY